MVAKSQKEEVQLLDPVHPQHAAGAECVKPHGGARGELRTLLLHSLTRAQRRCHDLPHGLGRQARDDALPRDLVRHPPLDELLQEALVRDPAVARLAPAPGVTVRVILARLAAGLGAGGLRGLPQVVHAVVVDLVLHEAAGGHIRLRLRGALAGGPCAARGVEEPDVINEHLSPATALRVDDSDDDLLSHVLGKVSAALHGEGVGVLAVLCLAEPAPVALADEVEAGARAGAPRALEAKPVGLVRQLEVGRCRRGCPPVVPNV
mmetsp:Transcript_62573/g.186443  ORF Transcript_62573/g.186443 Transcript_62573/m.186443 type:complete len:263 (+) Transcript_62573:920-1708(+)